MQVELVAHTPIMGAIKAIRQCWRSEGKLDSVLGSDGKKTTIGPNDEDLIHRIIGFGHTSTLEHAVFTFQITGMSRAILQELARHRIASLSVESTRFCLKRLLKPNVNEISDFVVDTGDERVNVVVLQNLQNVIDLMMEHPDISNDKLKYPLPEAFKTNLIWTINARSLRNFLFLRTSPKAHFEIRELAYKVYDALPEEAKTLVEDVLAD